MVGFFHRMYGKRGEADFFADLSYSGVVWEELEFAVYASGCVADVYACDAAVDEDTVGFMPKLSPSFHAWQCRFAAQFLLRHLHPIS